MAMMVSEEVANLFFVLTGERFPDANEDKLRALAKEWRAAAAELWELHRGIKGAVGTARSAFEGGAEQAFAARMAPWVEGGGLGPVPGGSAEDSSGGARGRGGGGFTGAEITAGDGGGLIGSAAVLFDSLADFLDKLAEDVEYVKLVIIYQLTLLLFEMWLAYILSPFTGGAAMAYLEGRFLIVQQLMKHLLGKLLLQFTTAWAIGTSFQLLVDVAAQVTQFGMGTRTDWNEKHTQTAAEVGAVGAAISLVTGPLQGPIADWMNNLLSKTFGKQFDNFGKNFGIILTGGFHESLTDLTYTGIKEKKLSDTFYGALTAGMASSTMHVLGDSLGKAFPWTDFDFDAWVAKRLPPQNTATPEETTPLLSDTDLPAESDVTDTFDDDATWSDFDPSENSESFEDPADNTSPSDPTSPNEPTLLDTPSPLDYPVPEPSSSGDPQGVRPGSESWGESENSSRSAPDNDVWWDQNAPGLTRDNEWWNTPLPSEPADDTSVVNDLSRTTPPTDPHVPSSNGPLPPQGGHTVEFAPGTSVLGDADRTVLENAGRSLAADLVWLHENDLPLPVVPAVEGVAYAGDGDIAGAQVDSVQEAVRSGYADELARRYPEGVPPALTDAFRTEIQTSPMPPPGQQDGVGAQGGGVSMRFSDFRPATVAHVVFQPQSAQPTVHQASPQGLGNLDHAVRQVAVTAVERRGQGLDLPRLLLVPDTTDGVALGRSRAEFVGDEARARLEAHLGELQAQLPLEERVTAREVPLRVANGQAELAPGAVGLSVDWAAPTPPRQGNERFGPGGRERRGDDVIADPRWRRSPLKAGGEDSKLGLNADWMSPLDNPVTPAEIERVRKSAPAVTVNSEFFDPVVGNSLRDRTDGNGRFVQVARPIRHQVVFDLRTMEVRPGQWVREWTFKLDLRMPRGSHGYSARSLVDHAQAELDEFINLGYRAPDGAQIRMRVELAKPGEAGALAVRVHPDETGTNSLFDWYPRTFGRLRGVIAHELGHAGGAFDENLDSQHGNEGNRVFQARDPSRSAHDGRDPITGERRRVADLENRVVPGGLYGGALFDEQGNRVDRHTFLPRHVWRLERTWRSLADERPAYHGDLAEQSAVPPEPDGTDRPEISFTDDRSRPSDLAESGPRQPDGFSRDAGEDRNHGERSRSGADLREHHRQLMVLNGVLSLEGIGQEPPTTGHSLEDSILEEMRVEAAARAHTNPANTARVEPGEWLMVGLEPNGNEDQLFRAEEPLRLGFYPGWGTVPVATRIALERSLRAFARMASWLYDNGYNFDDSEGDVPFILVSYPEATNASDTSRWSPRTSRLSDFIVRVLTDELEQIYGNDSARLLLAELRIWPRIEPELPQGSDTALVEFRNTSEFVEALDAGDVPSDLFESRPRERDDPAEDSFSVNLAPNSTVIDRDLRHELRRYGRRFARAAALRTETNQSPPSIQVRYHADTWNAASPGADRSQRILDTMLREIRREEERLTQQGFRSPVFGAAVVPVPHQVDASAESHNQFVVRTVDINIGGAGTLWVGSSEQTLRTRNVDRAGWARSEPVDSMAFVAAERAVRWHRQGLGLQDLPPLLIVPPSRVDARDRQFVDDVARTIESAVSTRIADHLTDLQLSTPIEEVVMANAVRVLVAPAMPAEPPTDGFALLLGLTDPSSPTPEQDTAAEPEVPSSASFPRQDVEGLPRSGAPREVSFEPDSARLTENDRAELEVDLRTLARAAVWAREQGQPLPSPTLIFPTGTPPGGNFLLAGERTFGLSDFVRRVLTDELRRWYGGGPQAVSVDDMAIRTNFERTVTPASHGALVEFHTIERFVQAVNTGAAPQDLLSPIGPPATYQRVDNDADGPGSYLVIPFAPGTAQLSEEARAGLEEDSRQFARTLAARNARGLPLPPAPWPEVYVHHPAGEVDVGLETARGRAITDIFRDSFRTEAESQRARGLPRLPTDEVPVEVVSLQDRDGHGEQESGLANLVTVYLPLEPVGDHINSDARGNASATEASSQGSVGREPGGFTADIPERGPRQPDDFEDAFANDPDTPGDSRAESLTNQDSSPSPVDSVREAAEATRATRERLAAGVEAIRRAEQQGRVPTSARELADALLASVDEALDRAVTLAADARTRQDDIRTAEAETVTRQNEAQQTRRQIAQLEDSQRTLRSRLDQSMPDEQRQPLLQQHDQLTQQLEQARERLDHRLRQAEQASQRAEEARSELRAASEEAVRQRLAVQDAEQALGAYDEVLSPASDGSVDVGAAPQATQGQAAGEAVHQSDSRFEDTVRDAASAVEEATRARDAVATTNGEITVQTARIMRHATAAERSEVTALGGIAGTTHGHDSAVERSAAVRAELLELIARANTLPYADIESVRAAEQRLTEARRTPDGTRPTGVGFPPVDAAISARAEAMADQVEAARRALDSARHGLDSARTAGQQAEITAARTRFRDAENDQRAITEVYNEFRTAFAAMFDGLWAALDAERANAAAVETGRKAHQTAATAVTTAHTSLTAAEDGSSSVRTLLEEANQAAARAERAAVDTRTVANRASVARTESEQADAALDRARADLAEFDRQRELLRALVDLAGSSDQRSGREAEFSGVEQRIRTATEHRDRLEQDARAAHQQYEQAVTELRATAEAVDRHRNDARTKAAEATPHRESVRTAEERAKKAKDEAKTAAETGDEQKKLTRLTLLSQDTHLGIEALGDTTEFVNSVAQLTGAENAEVIRAINALAPAARPAQTAPAANGTPQRSDTVVNPRGLRTAIAEGRFSVRGPGGRTIEVEIGATFQRPSDVTRTGPSSTPPPHLSPPEVRTETYVDETRTRTQAAAGEIPIRIPLMVVLPVDPTGLVVRPALSVGWALKREQKFESSSGTARRENIYFTTTVPTSMSLTLSVSGSQSVQASVDTVLRMADVTPFTATPKDIPQALLDRQSGDPSQRPRLGTPAIPAALQGLLGRSATSSQVLRDLLLSRTPGPVNVPGREGTRARTEGTGRIELIGMSAATEGLDTAIRSNNWQTLESGTVSASAGAMAGPMGLFAGGQLSVSRGVSDGRNQGFESLVTQGSNDAKLLYQVSRDVRVEQDGPGGRRAETGTVSGELRLTVQEARSLGLDLPAHLRRDQQVPRDQDAAYVFGKDKIRSVRAEAFVDAIVGDRGPKARAAVQARFDNPREATETLQTLLKGGDQFAWNDGDVKHVLEVYARAEHPERAMGSATSAARTEFRHTRSMLRPYKSSTTVRLPLGVVHRPSEGENGQPGRIDGSLWREAPRAFVHLFGGRGIDNKSGYLGKTARTDKADAAMADYNGSVNVVVVHREVRRPRWWRNLLLGGRMLGEAMSDRTSEPSRAAVADALEGNQPNDPRISIHRLERAFEASTTGDKLRWATRRLPPSTMRPGIYLGDPPRLEGAIDPRFFGEYAQAEHVEVNQNMIDAVHIALAKRVEPVNATEVSERGQGQAPRRSPSSWRSGSWSAWSQREIDAAWVSSDGTTHETRYTYKNSLVTRPRASGRGPVVTFLDEVGSRGVANKGFSGETYQIGEMVHDGRLSDSTSDLTGQAGYSWPRLVPGGIRPESNLRNIQVGEQAASSSRGTYGGVEAELGSSVVPGEQNGKGATIRGGVNGAGRYGRTEQNDLSPSTNVNHEYKGPTAYVLLDVRMEFAANLTIRNRVKETQLPDLPVTVDIPNGVIMELPVEHAIGVFEHAGLPVPPELTAVRGTPTPSVQDPAHTLFPRQDGDYASYARTAVIRSALNGEQPLAKVEERLRQLGVNDRRWSEAVLGSIGTLLNSTEGHPWLRDALPGYQSFGARTQVPGTAYGFEDVIDVRVRAFRSDRADGANPSDRAGRAKPLVPDKQTILEYLKPAHQKKSHWFWSAAAGLQLGGRARPASERDQNGESVPNNETGAYGSVAPEILGGGSTVKTEKVLPGSYEDRELTYSATNKLGRDSFAVDFYLEITRRRAPMPLFDTTLFGLPSKFDWDVPASHNAESTQTVVLPGEIDLVSPSSRAVPPLPDPGVDPEVEVSPKGQRPERGTPLLGKDDGWLLESIGSRTVNTLHQVGYAQLSKRPPGPGPVSHETLVQAAKQTSEYTREGSNSEYILHNLLKGTSLRGGGVMMASTDAYRVRNIIGHKHPTYDALFDYGITLDLQRENLQLVHKVPDDEALDLLQDSERADLSGTTRTRSNLAGGTNVQFEAGSYQHGQGQEAPTSARARPPVAVDASTDTVRATAGKDRKLAGVKYDGRSYLFLVTRADIYAEAKRFGSNWTRSARDSVRTWVRGKGGQTSVVRISPQQDLRVQVWESTALGKGLLTLYDVWDHSGKLPPGTATYQAKPSAHGGILHRAGQPQPAAVPPGRDAPPGRNLQVDTSVGLEDVREFVHSLPKDMRPVTYSVTPGHTLTADVLQRATSGLPEPGSPLAPQTASTIAGPSNTAGPTVPPRSPAQPPQTPSSADSGPRQPDDFADETDDTNAPYVPAALTAPPLDRSLVPDPPAIDQDYSTDIPRSLYERYLVRDPANPIPLFDGDPKREEAVQGQINDCGLVVALGAIAGHRPDTIRRAIRPTGDGGYSVTLYDIEPTTLLDPVARPTGSRYTLQMTDAIPVNVEDVALSPTGAAVMSAGWAALMEKAIAGSDQAWDRHRRDHWDQMWEDDYKPAIDSERSEAGLGNSPDTAPTGYNRLELGFDLDRIVNLLAEITGEEATMRAFPNAQQGEAALLAEFQSQLAAGKPVIVGSRTPNGGEVEPFQGFQFQHYFEVTSVDTGWIHLRNPWTNSTTPLVVDVPTFWEYFQEHTQNFTSAGHYATVALSPASSAVGSAGLSGSQAPHTEAHRPPMGDSIAADSGPRAPEDFADDSSETAETNTTAAAQSAPNLVPPRLKGKSVIGLSEAQLELTFTPQSSNLGADARARLDEVARSLVTTAQWLRANNLPWPKTWAELSGYAGIRGTGDAELGEARAQAVNDALRQSISTELERSRQEAEAAGRPVSTVTADELDILIRPVPVRSGETSGNPVDLVMIDLPDIQVSGERIVYQQGSSSEPTLDPMAFLDYLREFQDELIKVAQARQDSQLNMPRLIVVPDGSEGHEIARQRAEQLRAIISTGLEMITMDGPQEASSGRRAPVQDVDISVAEGPLLQFQPGAVALVFDWSVDPARASGQSLRAAESEPGSMPRSTEERFGPGGRGRRGDDILEDERWARSSLKPGEPDHRTGMDASWMSPRSNPVTQQEIDRVRHLARPQSVEMVLPYPAVDDSNLEQGQDGRQFVNLKKTVSHLIVFEERIMEVRPDTWVREWTVKLPLIPHGAARQWDLDSSVIAAAQEDLNSYVNRGYRAPDGAQVFVRVELVESSDPEFGVHVFPGDSSRESQKFFHPEAWKAWLGAAAHELLHYLGLVDEYLIREDGKLALNYRDPGNSAHYGRDPRTGERRRVADLRNRVRNGGLMANRPYDQGRRYVARLQLLPRHVWLLENVRRTMVDERPIYFDELRQSMGEAWEQWVMNTSGSVQSPGGPAWTATSSHPVAFSGNDDPGLAGHPRIALVNQRSAVFDSLIEQATRVQRARTPLPPAVNPAQLSSYQRFARERDLRAAELSVGHSEADVRRGVPWSSFEYQPDVPDAPVQEIATQGGLPAWPSDVDISDWEKLLWEATVAGSERYDNRSWRVAGKILATNGIRADLTRDIDGLDAGELARMRLIDQLQRLVAATIAETGSVPQAELIARYYSLRFHLGQPSGTAGTDTAT